MVSRWWTPFLLSLFLLAWTLVLLSVIASRVQRCSIRRARDLEAVLVCRFIPIFGLVILIDSGFCLRCSFRWIA